MARSTKTQTTGNTPFTGTEYVQMLEVRKAAMSGFAEGTVTPQEKGAARVQVRNARTTITKAGFTVKGWREAEQVREAALPKVRKPRTTKAEQVVEA